MTESQQKLYIDRDSARQFLFYKTDSKIPDIKCGIKYDTKFSASQTGLSDEFSIRLFSHSSRVLKVAQKILFALLLILFCSTAEAIKGPIIVNTDVLSGSWKAIRLKNLPKDAVVALEIKSDGEIMVVLVDSNDYQSFPNTSRPLFLGRVEKKLSFSVSIPESGHYYVILDNRTGRRKRAITVTAAAARGEMDQISAANSILRVFERQLHQIFIFDSFPIGVERCDTSKAFADRLGIILCAGYVQQIDNHIRDRQKAQDALGFSIFHELGRILLAQWNHPAAARKATADEFATVLMIMLKQTEKLSDNAENFAQNPLISETLRQVLKDDRHPLTVQRAKRISAWLKDPMIVLKWQKFLVPHMQTALLKRLQQYPTSWTDLPIVEKELALRAQKFTRKDLQKTPSKAPVKLRAVLRNSEHFEDVAKGDRLYYFDFCWSNYTRLLTARQSWHF
ncbi:MAG: DUF1883 domain-containing protein [Deltaproteobacteria bacterium]|jgi:hypothetical protein|nr:DUF1883 domain-containing protein [Deltaproteobacteria bacterium]